MASDGATAATDNAHPTTEPPIQWDGDRMFNIYIHDYCLKRGFVKTANELTHEAAIPPQSQPPINAKQGLLFEWWSVFWVLFTAKSNGHGSEDALLYTQHQTAAQNAAQKLQNRPGQPGQQQPIRYANGVRPPNQSGPQPNGVIPPAPQQSLPNGTNSVSFPSNMSQPNGVPGSSSGPPGGTMPPQGQNLSQHHPNQRPPGPPPPPQRGMNGAPFQSPTMAHSPPNPPPGAMQPNSSIGANQPLTRAGMLPPNGPPGPMGPMGTAQLTPQPPFQSMVGRSPSNPGSPAQGNMMAPSPSMSHRLPPGMVPLSPDMLNTEINRIPPPLLQKFKQDLNLDKDVSAMSIEEKQQLVVHFRRSNIKPPMPGPSGLAPGQPGPNPMQPHPGLRNPQMPGAQHQGQPPLPPPQGSNQQQRGAKRSSTSPGQEPEQLPRNDSSPPNSNKRVRISPGNGEPQPPMTPMYPPHQQQQGMHPMSHSQMQANGMRGQMPMPFAGPPMGGINNPMLGHGIGTPQMSPMNPPMNPSMMGGPPPGGMVNTPQLHQYRQSMATMHKNPHLQQQMLPVGSPSASDPGGNMAGGGPPANRPVQNKPMVGMMPPPSPAMAAKPKPDDGSSANGHIDASPQNVGIGGHPPAQHPGAPAGPPPASTPTPHTPREGTMTAPSPSAILNSAPNMSNHPPPPPPNATDGLDTTTPFSIDFGPSGLDFDPSNMNLFAGDSSLNFERDFAAWFDPESAT